MGSGARVMTGMPRFPRPERPARPWMPPWLPCALLTVLVLTTWGVVAGLGRLAGLW